MIAEQINAALLAAGYQKAQAPWKRSEGQLYYKRSGVSFTSSDGETQHGQLEVTHFDFDVDGPPIVSFQVGSTFVTRLGWLQSRFYGVNEDQIMQRLPAMESELMEMQRRLMEAIR